MNIFQKITGTIRDVINIEFRGPNAWIIAVAIIIASVGLNVNSIPVIIGTIQEMD